MRTTVLILISSLLLFSTNLFSEEVTLKYKDLTLNANLELADGKTLKDGVVLMTHGTLAQSKHSVMEQLQQSMLDNGMSSLSINLSLGIDKREGMYDCAVKHTHKHTDALDEIGAWLEWLKTQGASNITLLGHSRGGNQTAWFAAERDQDAIKRVVLLAPSTWNEDDAAKEYQEKYGAELAPLLKQAQDLVSEGKSTETLKKVNFIYCKDTEVNADSFASYYTPEPRFHTPNLLAKIKKPVLLLVGSEDKVVKNLIPAVEALKEDNTTTLTVIDGAGHMFRDLYADEVVENMLEFDEK